MPMADWQSTLVRVLLLFRSCFSMILAMTAAAWPEKGKRTDAKWTTLQKDQHCRRKLTPIYVQIRSNAILTSVSVDQGFAVKNSGVTYLTLTVLTFNLRNSKMQIQHTQNRFKLAKYDNSVPFCSRLTWTGGLVVKPKCCASDSDVAVLFYQTLSTVSRKPFLGW